MLDHDDGDAALVQAAEHLKDRSGPGGIELRCGFVEEQHLWAHRQQAGKGQPLQLAAAQVERMALGQRADADDPHRLLDTLFDLGLGHAVALRAESDLFVDALARTGDLSEGILEKKPDVGRALDHLDPSRFGAEHGDIAAQPAAEEMGRKAHREQAQRRFAGVGGAGDPHPLPCFDANVDVAHGLTRRLLVGVTDVFEEEGRLAHLQPRRRATIAAGTASASAQRVTRCTAVSVNS